MDRFDPGLGSLSVKARNALVALAVYAGLVSWLTWPFAARLGTHLADTRAACRYDPLYMGWVLSYESHVLSTAPSKLLDANIYFPTRHTLFYGDTGFGALPYFMPIFLTSGNPTLSLNLVLLGSIVLTAWMLHMVVVDWTGSHLAGTVGAMSFLTTRWVLWEFVPTAPSYAVLQYFPLIIMLVARPTLPWRRAMLLLPVLVLQCLTDVVYVASAVLAPLGLIALGRLTRRSTRRDGLRLAIVLACVVLALVPVYLGHLAVGAANPNLHRQTVWLFALAPTALPWGPILSGPTAVPVTAMALAALGLVGFAWRRGSWPAGKRRAWAHALLWACVGSLMSLSPTVTWAGASVDLSRGMIERWLPIYRLLRVPSRLGVAGLMGLVLLAGLAFHQCEEWIVGRYRRRSTALGARILLAASILVLMYANYAIPGGQLVARRTPIPPSFHLMRAISPGSPIIEAIQRRDGPLLEVPVPRVQIALLPGDSPVTHARAMYRSIFHWRPLVNGYSSYWPQGFAKRMNLAWKLPDQASLHELRREAGLETLLVHSAAFAPREREAWLAIADAGAPTLRLIVRDGDDLLFAVGDENASGTGGSPTP